MKIVVLDGYTLNPGDLSWEGLQKLGDVSVYDRTDSTEIAARASDAEIVLTNKTVLDTKTLDTLPKLRYIGVLATGYNVVDLAAARRHGLVVTNIPAYSTDSVAQMVFAHILNITQRVEHYASQTRQGVWTSNPDFSYYDTPLTELHGKRIGIIGFGHIGQAVARIATAFGMEALVFTSKPQAELPDGCTKASLDGVFGQSDIVTLHCPLTPDTDKLVNAARLAQMRRGAILINTGRGGLVDETALADALKNRHLLAAGLDVLSSEPPRTDNPLTGLDNCFITPHIAWATKEARVRLMELAVSNVRNFLSGNITNNVLQ